MRSLGGRIWNLGSGIWNQAGRVDNGSVTSADHLLAIDFGTQSVRALLFDPRGNLAARSRVGVEPYFSDHPGWAEQDPLYMWRSLCEACQSLWELSPVAKGAVAGVALTTQRATMVNVDADGDPLRPAIIWLDQRRCEGLPPVGGLWGLAFRAVRMRETVAHFQAEAEANWLQRHQREIWDRTHKYLFLSGFLTYRLAGRFVDSVGCQVGYVPFDYRRLRWAAPRDWKWQAVPVARGLLPELVPPGERLGEITREAAEATGIPAGTPLIAGAATAPAQPLTPPTGGMSSPFPCCRPSRPRCRVPTAWKCKSIAAIGWCRGSNRSSGSVNGE
jgi:sugar (pentulose or hexulose) kinase